VPVAREDTVGVMASHDAWWDQATDEEKLAELGRLRAEARTRRAALEARFPLPDAREWLARAKQIAFEQRRWAVAFDSGAMPSGDEISGLVLIDVEVSGRVWWTARTGMGICPRPEDIHLRAGDADLSPKSARSVWNACRAAVRAGLEDVETRCYDGIDVSLVLLDELTGATMTAACNPAGPGREPALTLARRILRVVHQYEVQGWGAAM
jgi:hypothetical protein